MINKEKNVRTQKTPSSFPMIEAGGKKRNVRECIERTSGTAPRFQPSYLPFLLIYEIYSCT